MGRKTTGGFLRSEAAFTASSRETELSDAIARRNRALATTAIVGVGLVSDGWMILDFAKANIQELQAMFEALGVMFGGMGAASGYAAYQQSNRIRNLREQPSVEEIFE